MNAATLIDTGHLDLYIAGDDALRDEILGIFEEQAETWSNLLDPAASDAAWHDAAHALKGASRGVGAWALGDLCEQAEFIVGSFEAKEEKRAEILDSLRKLTSETIAEVRRLRDLPVADRA